LVLRFINLIKLLSSYFLSRLLRKVIHWGHPASLSIEPTNYCNLHCPECPSGMDLLTRKKGNMNFEIFQNLVDQLSPGLFYLNLYFQGEPYLNPGFPEMIRYAKSKRLYVATSTNGHFLTPENVRPTIESRLDRLIISLDGADAETYKQYRSGGDFEKVITGIKEIIEQKKRSGSKKPRVVIQFLLLKSNEHQINQIRKLGKDLGVDKIELKTAQFCEFKQGNPLMPDNPGFSRYKKIQVNTADIPHFEIRNRMPNHCFRMWSSCVVTWDGEVVPCCFDKDATYKMGNLNEKPFKQIWKDKFYREFRKKIFYSRKSIDICNNCTEGTGITFFL
jgi:radical SAM protein with 4Fe4S-binding SPASM domain